MTRRLGIDTFSLRHQGHDAFGFIDEAVRLGLDVVQYSTRENLASHDPGYLDEVRAHAAAHAVDIEIGMGSIDKHAKVARKRGDGGYCLGTGVHMFGERHGAPAINLRAEKAPDERRPEACTRPKHVGKLRRGVAPLRRETLGVLVDTAHADLEVDGVRRGVGAHLVEVARVV